MGCFPVAEIPGASSEASGGLFSLQAKIESALEKMMPVVREILGIARNRLRGG